MLPFTVMIDADYAPLEDAEIALDGVRVNLTPYIFLIAMPDHFMRSEIGVFVSIGYIVVCHEIGGLIDVLNDHPPKIIACYELHWL